MNEESSVKTPELHPDAAKKPVVYTLTLSSNETGVVAELSDTSMYRLAHNLYKKVKKGMKQARKEINARG